MQTKASETHYFVPGSPPYEEATSPHNTSGSQRPAEVARPTDAAGVVDAIRYARRRGLSIAVQATGHGAAGDIGDDILLIDTSALAQISIDAGERVARAGAGASWGAVNAAAEPHGLLGLAGSSPTVSVSGYTFGGGVGWLTRPHGLASSHLRSVDWVDLDGRLRHASDDADDAIDRDALWSFRGGNGVGIAVELEFDLIEVPDLHAGFLLWPADALPGIARAWASSLTEAGPSLTTSLGVLRAPSAPPFPPELQGTAVVHLAIAAAEGPGDAAALLAALSTMPAPAVDTWGPVNADELAGIHLDPPVAVPAVGGGRWLDEGAGPAAADILGVALEPGSPLLMVELRYVAHPHSDTDGAMTNAPAPFLLHAVGDATDADARHAFDRAFDLIRGASAEADIGRSAASFSEGTLRVAEALTPPDLARRAAIQSAVDPSHIIRTGRQLV